MSNIFKDAFTEWDRQSADPFYGDPFATWDVIGKDPFEQGKTPTLHVDEKLLTGEGLAEVVPAQQLTPPQQ